MKWKVIKWKSCHLLQFTYVWFNRFYSYEPRKCKIKVKALHYLFFYVIFLKLRTGSSHMITIKNKKAATIMTRNNRLTSSGGFQRLLCCRGGSRRQAAAPRCSWTCGQSWRYRPCRASPQGSAHGRVHNLSSGPAQSPASHILSYFPPA